MCCASHRSPHGFNLGLVQLEEQNKTGNNIVTVMIVTETKRRRQSMFSHFRACSRTLEMAPTTHVSSLDQFRPVSSLDQFRPVLRGTARYQSKGDCICPSHPQVQRAAAPSGTCAPGRFGASSCPAPSRTRRRGGSACYRSGTATSNCGPERRPFPRLHALRKG